MDNDVVCDKSEDDHKNECKIDCVRVLSDILLVEKVKTDKSTDQITLAGKE